MKRKRLYGTFTCQYNNGRVILPVSFPVRNGTVAFIGTSDADMNVSNFSFQDIEYWDNAIIRNGSLLISGICPDYPYDILSLTGFGTNFQLCLLPAASQHNSSGVSEEESLICLENYLTHAVITPIEKGKYEFILLAIDCVNEPGSLFSPDLPPLEGLTKDIYRKLFRLQYLPYSEKVKKDKPGFTHFKSVKSYDPHDNKRLLKELENSFSPTDKILVDWAKKQSPVFVPVKEERITCFTPRNKNKEMRLWHVNGAILGSNSPYEEDYSSYLEIDVYKNGGNQNEYRKI